MAVKTKTQLHADTAALPAPITRASLITVLDDMIDSYEDLIQEFTTAQRDALTPFQGQKIFNTTNLRVEIYSNGTGLWLPASQKTVVFTDCSGNPNYPEAGVGDALMCSVAGKIGGASGKAVYVGDIIYCGVKNAGGTEASVGTSWQVCYSNDATNVPTRYAEISLSSPQILALNTSPQTLVAAPGAGKIIVVERSIKNFIWNSIAYATNVNLRLRNPTAASTTSIGTISGTANRVDTFGNDLTVVANEALQVWVETGDPTAGDSTMTVGVYYKIHTL